MLLQRYIPRPRDHAEGASAQGRTPRKTGVARGPKDHLSERILHCGSKAQDNWESRNSIFLVKLLVGFSLCVLGAKYYAPYTPYHLLFTTQVS